MIRSFTQIMEDHDKRVKLGLKPGTIPIDAQRAAAMREWLAWAVASMQVGTEPAKMPSKARDRP